MDYEVRTNLSRGIKPEVEKLAKEILTREEIIQAEGIIALVFSGNPNESDKSGSMLASLIPVRPKRPLYYVNFEVSHGPEMVTWHAPISSDIFVHINQPLAVRA